MSCRAAHQPREVRARGFEEGLRRRGLFFATPRLSFERRRGTSMVGALAPRWLATISRELRRRHAHFTSRHDAAEISEMGRVSGVYGRPGRLYRTPTRAEVTSVISIAHDGCRLMIAIAADLRV